jgi:hypothetical protein
MSLNQKLTHVIQGRAIAGASHQDAKLIVTFGDGSAMTIKTGDSTIEAIPMGAAVQSVRQDVSPPQLHLDLANGGSWSVPLAEATSCVMVRDAAGKLEYAD